jgi:hypothetical protein
MRTTVDLPEDLHRIARSIARDTDRTLSEAVAMLMRRGLGSPDQGVSVSRDEDTGLPLIRVGVPITSEDVRAVDDD